MIVFCEDCGGRNDVDEDLIRKKKAVQCSNCHEILRIQVPLEPLPHLQKKEKEPETGGIPIPRGGTLEVRYGDQTLALSRMRPTATLGRQEHNDLEIIDTRVSRSHARIEFRNGEFYLIDHSTNGTYVEMGKRNGVNLKRSELVLEGSGIIALGRKIPADSPRAIHFEVKE
ncbi:MAG: hypothetical protein CSB33_03470 [Desulfobacterales bacterium]|nr:MAG: hypothetical protein CSB33_03470 [Desulfobacterales bacterium]